MDISRRDALKIGAGAAAFCLAGVSPRSVLAQDRKKIPIGLQLWSLRDEAAKDLPGVIRSVGKMGYDAVEFAGYFKQSAADLRKVLDDSGLKCCGTHIGLTALVGDALKETIEFNKTLGNKLLIVPGLPADRTANIAALKDTAKVLTEIAAKVKPDGLLVGYHAHAPDFRKIDDTTPWDALFTNAGPDVVMQLDTSNCLDGEGDPVAILKKYPGRSKTIHLKEYGKPGVLIGEGDVKWKDILALCESTGGTEWYVIEQETYVDTPAESARKDLENLRKLLK
jgi:sugar phosphate isomerase/epimerase